MRNHKVHIRVRRNGLYLDYFFRGERTVNTLKLKNTPENWIIAEEKARQLEEKLSALDDSMTKAGFKKEKWTSSIVQDTLTIINTKKELKKLTSYTISDAKKAFLAETKKSKRNAEMYNSAVKAFILACLDKEVKDITEDDYNTFKTYLLENKAYATSATYINYMRLLFNWLEKKGKYYNPNPFIRLKKRNKLNIRTIEQTHFDLILQKLKETNEKLYNFINFLRLTGFRKEEALQLKWSQIDFQKKHIKVITFKDNEREDIFPMKINGGELLKFMEEMYEKRKDDNDIIFDLHSEWILKPFQKVIEKVNAKLKEDKKKIVIPKYTLHDIRRTAISRWAKYVTPNELTKLARHKNIATTMQFYISLDMDDIAKKIK